METAMALFDDMLKSGNLVTGLVVGAGALIVWPLVGPALRSVAKTTIKGGLIAYRQAEQLYAGAVEGVGDMIAEAQQEVGATTPARGRADGSGSQAT
jgi:hypothetical protein